MVTPQRGGASQKSHGLVHGYRSGLEEDLAGDLRRMGVPFVFEEVKIPFVQPVKPRTYTPDFILPNFVIVETKGRFVTEDRQKHLLVRDQHPDLDIRFVFNRSASRIGKQSTTTYADWCGGKNKRRFRFIFSDKSIPQEWLREPVNEASRDALLGLGFKDPFQ